MVDVEIGGSQRKICEILEDVVVEDAKGLACTSADLLEGPNVFPDGVMKFPLEHPAACLVGVMT